MFQLFKRNKNRAAVLHEGWLKVGNYINRNERAFANWLNTKAAGLSPVMLTTIIMFVCAAFATASTYLIVRNIKTTASSSAKHSLPHPFKK